MDMFEQLGRPRVALGCPRAILISSEPRARCYDFLLFVYFTMTCFLFDFCFDLHMLFFFVFVDGFIFVSNTALHSRTASTQPCAVAQLEKFNIALYLHIRT